MKRRVGLSLLGAGLATLLVHSVGWGRLMALAPWAPGFERLEGARAVVLFRPGGEEEARRVLEVADGLVGPVEEDHRLAFRHPPEILLPATEEEHRRLSWGRARLRALPVRGRVFIAPRARAEAGRGQIHLDVYLRHELSHTLLLQHLGVRGALGLPPWFEEGLATLRAGQLGVDGYFDRPQVLAWWRQGRAIRPSEWDSRRRESPRIAALPPDERFHFLYAQFALFVADLVAQGGEARFDRLVERLLAHEPMASAFAVEYGTSPDAWFDALVARGLAPAGGEGG